MNKSEAVYVRTNEQGVASLNLNALFSGRFIVGVLLLCGAGAYYLLLPSAQAILYLVVFALYAALNLGFALWRSSPAAYLSALADWLVVAVVLGTSVGSSTPWSLLFLLPIAVAGQWAAWISFFVAGLSALFVMGGATLQSGFESLLIVDSFRLWLFCALFFLAALASGFGGSTGSLSMGLGMAALSRQREADLLTLQKRLEAMEAASRAFARSTDTETLIPLGLGRLLSTLSLGAGFIARPHTVGEGYSVDEMRGVDEQQTTAILKALEPILSQLHSDEPLVISKTESDPQRSRLLKVVENAGFSNVLLMHLTMDEQILGVMVALTRRATDSFNHSDLVTLRLLGRQFSASLHMAALIEQLQLTNKELQHLDQLKSDFLATVSHELRTPLTSIIGYSDMILAGLTGELSEKQALYVQSILDNGENLLHIINDILDLTKIESGKLKLHREPVDLIPILSSVLSVIKPEAGKRKINITTFLNSKTPRLDADPGKLSQILLNLISNAVKYNFEGGKISIESRDPGTDLMEIWVSDTGRGIAKEDYERIFEPFAQVEHSATRTQGGTGLGLAIVRNLVELHGGTVRVESEISQGSRFIFTMPKAQT